MSTRRVDSQVAHANALRQELAYLREAAIVKPPMETKEIATDATAEPVPKVDFDSLSGVEQAAASLGATPNEYRPIGWLNEGVNR
jgi:hypothetical protein